MAREEAGGGGLGERMQDSCLAFTKGGPYIPACSTGSSMRTPDFKSGWPANVQVVSVLSLPPPSPLHHLPSPGPWFLTLAPLPSTKMCSGRKVLREGQVVWTEWWTQERGWS